MNFIQSSIVIISLFFSINTFGQRENLTINLEEHITLDSLDYYFSDIIDNRIIKDNIGFAYIGLNDRKVPVVCKGGLVKHLSNLLSTDDINKKHKLILSIKRFYVTENIEILNQNGKSFVSIEILKDFEGEILSYGTYEHERKYKDFEASTLHERILGETLQVCIDSFNVDFKKNKPLVKREEKNFDKLDVYSVIPKGIYSTYLDLISGNPESIEDVEIHKSLSTEIYERYEMIISDMINEDAFAFSDGQDLYLNANNYKYISDYYIKAMSYGRYIYFEDRFSGKKAARHFGLAGSLISNVRRQIVLDTTTGFVFELNHDSMEWILKDYPELSRKYFSVIESDALSKMALDIVNKAEKEKQ